MSSEEISDLVGDGNAKITVSFGVADKHYGSGVDAHVSVSLTCDQDSGILGFAYEAASEIAISLAKDAIDKAKELGKECGVGDVPF